MGVTRGILLLVAEIGVDWVYSSLNFPCCVKTLLPLYLSTCNKVEEHNIHLSNHRDRVLKSRMVEAAFSHTHIQSTKEMVD